MAPSTGNAPDSLRRSSRTRSPTKQSEQYLQSRNITAEKRENFKRSKNIQRQREEASQQPNGPPKATRQPFAVEVELPRPSRAQVIGSQGGRQAAPKPQPTKNAPAAKALPALPQINRAASVPIPLHPGSRPVSDDDLELGVLIEEWKRKRLIWFLTVCDNKPISNNTDYDDLKRVLGLDGGWDSEDELNDRKVIQRRSRAPTTSVPTAVAPQNRPQIGQFDEEPQRRKPILVQNMSAPDVPSSSKDLGKRKATEEAGTQAKRLNTTSVAQLAQSHATQATLRKPNNQDNPNASFVAVQKSQTPALSGPWRAPSNPGRGSLPQARSGASSTNKSREPPHDGLRLNHSRQSALPEPTRHDDMAPTAPRVTNNSHNNSGAPKPPGNTAGNPFVQQQLTQPVRSGSSARPSSSVSRASVQMHPASTRMSAQGADRGGSTGPRHESHSGSSVTNRARSSNNPAQAIRDTGRNGGHVLTIAAKQTGSRGRLKFFEGVEKSILKLSGDALKAIMATQGMYETDPLVLAERRRQAWRLACEELEVDPSHYPLTRVHVQSMCDRLVSWRGKASVSIAPEIKYFYFNASFKTFDDAEAYAWIDELRQGRFHMKKGAPPGKGHFQHPVLQLCMDRMMFRDPSDIGVKYVDMFRKPSPELIAYFCSMIQYQCEKYLPDAPLKDKLEFDNQRRAYLTHLGSHQVWLKKRNARRWEMIQEQLFQRGFKHSRATVDADTDVVAKYMLREDGVDSDNPDDEELAAWEAELADLVPRAQSVEDSDAGHANPNNQFDVDEGGGAGADTGHGRYEEPINVRHDGGNVFEERNVPEVLPAGGYSRQLDADGGYEQELQDKTGDEFEESQHDTSRGWMAWRPEQTQATDANGRDGDDEQEYTQGSQRNMDDRDRTLSSDYGDDYAPRGRRKFVMSSEAEDE
ncbi:hypothetical protein V565_130290 [Rhizoctonia solani 123E]|uniref:DUF6532 domain-containing protein n=1 Tax=Rhizoctonia solani 123E TaxID=1423351 RepID=A0A074RUE4_9AGAM|nr:hypothetical protein V565_130290 [Rhizoctonia solani 123E]